MTSKSPEQLVHEAVAEYLDQAPPPGSWHTAIDHSSKSSRVAGALLKARGGKAGIPDHMILVRGFPAIFFEMKSRVGSLRKDQRDVSDAIYRNGCFWRLVRSIDDAEAALRLFGVPVRASAT